MSRSKKDNEIKPKAASGRTKSNGLKEIQKNKGRPRFANNGYRLPEPLPKGEILTDNFKEEWIVGDVIGRGGFGEIYAARKKTDKVKRSEDEWYYVVKVDNYTGPLFPEMHFYKNVTKQETIESWMEKEGLEFLGIPRHIASGIHDKLANDTSSPKPRGRAKPKSNSDFKEPKFRFLVIQRFGRDLQSILDIVKKFSVKTAFTLAIRILDVLKFIHSFGYIHLDIKASNLLLGYETAAAKRTTKGCYNEVYLVDYGLVERYMTREGGQHKPYEEDQRRANNGTVEFTSRDSHIGALSRRSDLEILAYNVLSWLSGSRLPWMPYLKDIEYVKSSKEYYMKNLHELVNFCFSENEEKVNIKDKTNNHKNSKSILDRKKVSANVPYGVVELLQYIANLEFTEQPDYDLLKKILETGIEKVGEKYDGYFSFDASVKSPRRSNIKASLSQEKEPFVATKRTRSQTNHVESVESNASESPPKKPRGSSKEVGSNGKKMLQKSRSRKPISVPTTLTPTKTNARQKTRTPTLDNPTPAMIELLQKLKQKKLKK